MTWCQWHYEASSSSECFISIGADSVNTRWRQAPRPYSLTQTVQSDSRALERRPLSCMGLHMPIHFCCRPSCPSCNWPSSCRYWGWDKESHKKVTTVSCLQRMFSYQSRRHRNDRSSRCRGGWLPVWSRSTNRCSYRRTTRYGLPSAASQCGCTTRQKINVL